MRKRVLEGRICPLSGASQTHGHASVELDPHRIRERHDLGLGPMLARGPRGDFKRMPDIEFDVVTAPLPGTDRSEEIPIDIRHSWSLDRTNNAVPTLEIAWDTHSTCRLVELRYIVRGAAAA